MKVTITFNIPDEADPLLATLDYYIFEGENKGLCCAEVFGCDIKEVDIDEEKADIKLDEKQLTNDINYHRKCCNCCHYDPRN